MQHAKYILVFNTKGLHVAISTANVIRSNQTIDITWTGYFPRISGAINSQTDFGIILQDFLEQQSDQIIARHFDEKCCRVENLLQWMEEVLGFNDISHEYDFSKAGVDLISTVPGNDPIPISIEKEECIYKEAYERKKWLQNSITGHCDGCIRKIHSRYRKREIPKNLSLSGTTVGLRVDAQFRTYTGSAQYAADVDEILKGCDWTKNVRRPSEKSHFKYGAERIRECILRHQVHLPDNFLDKDDQLIMQPTSISGGMNVRRMSYLISCFKPHSVDIEDNDNFRTLRLIWPSCELLRVINDTRRERWKRGEDKHYFHSGSGLYLNDKSLDEMLADGWNRMYSYQSSSSVLCSASMMHAPPHNKSYGRIIKRSIKVNESNTLNENMNGTHQEGISKEGDVCICYDLSFFLLTSACLSRGALGDRIDIDICQECHYIRPGYFEYKNFELGVLLQSSKKMQYKALNPKCVCHGNGKLLRKEKNVCILPVPYDMLGGDKYYNEDVEAFRKDVSEPWVMIRDANREETKKRLLNVYNTHFRRSMGPVHNGDTDSEDLHVSKRGEEIVEPPFKKAIVSKNQHGEWYESEGKQEDEGEDTIISISRSTTTPRKLHHTGADVYQEDKSFDVLSPSSAGVMAYLWSSP